MKKYIIDGKTIETFTYRAYEDTARWILNKMDGRVVRCNKWDYTRITDYEWLKKILDKVTYSHYVIMSEPPKGSRLFATKFCFKVYEVTAIDPRNTFCPEEKILVFVSRGKNVGQYRKRGKFIETF
jgi:hypothetical protein